MQGKFTLDMVRGFENSPKARAKVEMPKVSLDSVQLNCPYHILQAFQKELENSAILGVEFYNPYTKKNETFPTQAKELTARHLQILARNESANVNGKMKTELYGGLLTDNQIAMLRGLVKATTVAGVAYAMHYRGYRNIETRVKLDNPMKVIVVDQAGLQWQDDFRNTGGMFFFPDKTALPETAYQENAAYQKNALKAIYGKNRSESSGENSLKLSWNTVPGALDLNLMSDAIKNEFLQALDAAKTQGDLALAADEIIDFRFLMAGTGYFADGLNFKDKDKIKFENARLLGIKAALIEISKLPEDQKAKVLGKIKCITLPFSGEDTIINEIKVLTETLGLEWGGSGSIDALEPREGYVIATTNCADPHAAIVNEGALFVKINEEEKIDNLSSVDAAIGTNADVAHLTVPFNSEMQLRITEKPEETLQHEIVEEKLKKEIPAAKKPHLPENPYTDVIAKINTFITINLSDEEKLTKAKKVALEYLIKLIENNPKETLTNIVNQWKTTKAIYGDSEINLEKLIAKPRELGFLPEFLQNMIQFFRDPTASSQLIQAIETETRPILPIKAPPIKTETPPKPTETTTTTTIPPIQQVPIPKKPSPPPTTTTTQLPKKTNDFRAYGQVTKEIIKEGKTVVEVDNDAANTIACHYAYATLDKAYQGRKTGYTDPYFATSIWQVAPPLTEIHYSGEQMIDSNGNKIGRNLGTNQQGFTITVEEQQKQQQNTYLLYDESSIRTYLKEKGNVEELEIFNRDGAEYFIQWYAKRDENSLKIAKEKQEKEAKGAKFDYGDVKKNPIPDPTPFQFAAKVMDVYWMFGTDEDGKHVCMKQPVTLVAQHGIRTNCNKNDTNNAVALGYVELDESDSSWSCMNAKLTEKYEKVLESSIDIYIKGLVLQNRADKKPTHIVTTMIGTGFFTHPNLRKQVVDKYAETFMTALKKQFAGANSEDIPEIYLAAPRKQSAGPKEQYAELEYLAWEKELVKLQEENPTLAAKIHLENRSKRIILTDLAEQAQTKPEEMRIVAGVGADCRGDGGHGLAMALDDSDDEATFISSTYAAQSFSSNPQMQNKKAYVASQPRPEIYSINVEPEPATTAKENIEKTQELRSKIQETKQPEDPTPSVSQQKL